MIPICYCNHCRKFFYNFEELYDQHKNRPSKGFIMEESKAKEYRELVKAKEQLKGAV